MLGNLTRADDWRTGAEWPDNNRPVTRTWEYDSYSRLTKTTYTYPGSSNNTWQAPFAAENATSTLEPRPVPQISYSSRITEENFVSGA